MINCSPEKEGGETGSLKIQIKEWRASVPRFSFLFQTNLAIRLWAGHNKFILNQHGILFGQMVITGSLLSLS